MMEQNNECMFAEERKRLIVDLVNKEIKTKITTLCERFSVSSATIRNDLRELEFAGLIKRTHGGAISNSRANYEPNSYQKEISKIEEKRAIAQAAFRYIQEGDTIALDTGTTLFEFAKLLTGVKDLTVVTNDLQIADFLERESQAAVIIIGGSLRRNFHCTVGAKAVESLSGLNVDRVFLASNGVSIEKGITTPNIEMATVKEKLVKIADQVILLADSSKMGRSTFVKFADIQSVDILVTDAHLLREMADELTGAGVEVIVAEESV